MTTIWLTSSLFLLAFFILYFLRFTYTWLIGFVGSIIFQYLIIDHWEEAKLGIILNVFVLISSILLFGNFKFLQRIQQETKLLLDRNLSNKSIISEDDIKGLPLPVKNWLKKSGTVGSHFINEGKITQKVKMQMQPEQKDWVLGTAVQHTTVGTPGFIWSVKVKLNKILNFRGRDKFENGKGEMLIKINSLINVVNEKGSKIDEGALQRYLGEIVWFPSLALSPFISWEEIDEFSAKAVMNYKGTSGTGTFYFHQNGLASHFKALRFKDNTPDSKRIEWIIDIQEHKTFDANIEVPSKVTSTWKLNNIDWTWLQLEVLDLKYNQEN